MSSFDFQHFFEGISSISQKSRHLIWVGPFMYFEKLVLEFFLSLAMSSSQVRELNLNVARSYCCANSNCVTNRHSLIEEKFPENDNNNKKLVWHYFKCCNNLTEFFFHQKTKPIHHHHSLKKLWHYYKLCSK